MKRININWEAVIVLVLFLSMSLLPGWLQFSILMINILSFFLFTLILIKISNLKHYNEQKNIFKDFLNRNGQIIAVMSLAIFGFVIGLYDLYIFYKNPLRRDYDDFQQQERDRKLKKLGI